MALPLSNGVFVATFELEYNEPFWKGHVRALEFFGGVRMGFSYDNTYIAVSTTIGGQQRKLTQRFFHLAYKIVTFLSN